MEAKIYNRVIKFWKDALVLDLFLFAIFCLIQELSQSDIFDDQGMIEENLSYKIETSKAWTRSCSRLEKEVFAGGNVLSRAVAISNSGCGGGGDVRWRVAVGVNGGAQIS